MERLLRHFEEEREALTRRLLAMGGLAEEQLRQAVAGVINRQAMVLGTVLQQDGPINDLQREIDAHSLTILALHQPVAVDLRAVIGIVKVNSDLERVGDLAINIAQRGHEVVGHPPLPQAPLVERMGRHAATMLRDAVDACVRRREAVSLLEKLPLLGQRQGRPDLDRRAFWDPARRFCFVPGACLPEVPVISAWA